MMQTIDEEYDVDGGEDTEFVLLGEGAKGKHHIRERIEYLQDLRRLRQLLDDPDFIDL